MSIFFIGMILASTELIFTQWEKIEEHWKKQKDFFIAWICLLSIYLLYFTQTGNLRDLLFGVGEKQHGVLLPLGATILGYILSCIKKRGRDSLDISIISSGICVSIIALIEFFGYNIFTGAHYNIEGSWGALRSTSTLGNPNYVAGYLLMTLPIILSLPIHKIARYTLFALLCLGVYTTGSVIGLSIMGAYILFLTGKKYIGKHFSILFPLILVSLLCIVYGMYHESEKWLSLTSRFILMKHTLLGSSDSLLGMILGHGPSGVIDLYKNIRPNEIRSYFPDTMIIDSSHNIFIDIFFDYGVIGVSLFIGFIVTVWKHLDLRGKSGLILGLSFLSLNVFVISHMTLLIYFLTERKNEE